MATQHDYQVGENAAWEWLNSNESFYAGMIPQSVVEGVTKAVIDAVDAARAKANEAKDQKDQKDQKNQT